MTLRNAFADLLTRADLDSAPILGRLADGTDATRRARVSSAGLLHVGSSDAAGGLALTGTAYSQLRSRQGQVFTASSGSLSAGAVGSTTLRMMVRNPAGSGKSLYVFRLDLFTSSVIGYFSLLVNPTGALPTTAKTINNHFVGHPSVSVAQGFADAGAEMTGGSDSGIRIPVPSGSFNKLALEAPYIISPGVTLGIQATFAAATTVVATADWWEE